MGTSKRCPHCGAVQAGAPTARAAMNALYEEVARIREIAERREAEQQTVEALLEEIRMLRETVARLRGSTFQVARPTRVA